MRGLLLAGLVMIASPAEAGWQGAEWGMTVDQTRTRLAATLPGLANGSGGPAYSSSQHTVRLTGRYQSGTHRFRLDLAFDSSERLALIELRPDDMTKCWALRGDLRDRYGAAHEAPTTAVYEINRWRIPADNNVVELNIMKGGTTTCVLKYRPLTTANTRGL